MKLSMEFKSSKVFRYVVPGLLLVIFLTACTALSPAPTTVPTPSPLSTEVTTPTILDAIPTATETLVPTAAATATMEPQETQPGPVATETPAATEMPGTPGIILFIGDGMGANHRLAATWAASGVGGLLVMDNMPVHGLTNPIPANSQEPESASSATAMATGVQTNYGYLGVDPEGHAVTTILEYAQEAGWSVGLVSTVQLAHATPAAFAAHDADRTNYVNIARQIMGHNINVLLGGGENMFANSQDEGCYPGKGYQGNNLDMIADAVAFGYTYTCSPEEFATLDFTNVNYLLGFFGADEMLAPFQPSLADLTSAAIEVLSHDPDGFFLMVEAGQIDWASHDTDAENAIAFTLGLDAAVAHAKTFALGRPNTMIIVAGDHETGGMRLTQDGVGSYLLDGPFSMPNGQQFWVDWSGGHHTTELVPVTAQGPYTEMLSGEYPNTRIFDAMFLMLYTESQN